jgi:hypothetical protein
VRSLQVQDELVSRVEKAGRQVLAHLLALAERRCGRTSAGSRPRDIRPVPRRRPKRLRGRGVRREKSQAAHLAGTPR